MPKNNKQKFENILARVKKSRSDFDSKTNLLLRAMAEDLALLDQRVKVADKTITAEEKNLVDSLDAEALKLFKD